MPDAFFRLLLLLREIPAAPQRIDTFTPGYAAVSGSVAAARTLAQRLEAQGVRVTRRTLQRDLDRLSRQLPLVCHDDTKPYAWAWLESDPQPGRGKQTETLREVAARAASHIRRSSGCSPD